MKDKAIKNLDISDNQSKKSDNINEYFQKKTNEPVLNNSNHETYSTILDDSSIQEQLNESVLGNSFYINKELSASFLNKISSLIKSSYDSKHDYKYYHEQIVSNPDIDNEIKDLYSDHYSVIEEKLNEIRTIKQNKESAKAKLQPGYFSEQDDESEELIDKLSLEIDALEKEKTALKNSLIFLQSIISKKLEKIKDFIDRSDGFANNGIDYIDVANKNSDSYSILELLKEVRYERLIREGDINKFNALDDKGKLELLQYIAFDSNNMDVAKKLFNNCPNLRIDIFNHYITNEFWIEIYSNEEYQRYAENFYELSGATDNSLPNTPFWGIIILSKSNNLDHKVISNIASDFLQPQLPRIISDLGNIIDNYYNNNLSEISENDFNLISHISRYITEADVAPQLDTENSCADSIKKIQDFHSSYYNTSNLADSTVEDLSTIQVSCNRINTSENAFEYYSQNIIYKKSSSKYEIIHTCNTPSNDYNSSYTQTDAHIEQIHNQIQPSFVKPVYEYIKINKKNIKDKINEKKLDKKDEDKNNGSNESPIPAFIKGGIATVTTEFILFIIWSAYFYWHQNSIMAKRIEKITEDLKKLSTIEPTILIKHSKKIKSIFDNIYEEDEENKEEDYFDIDEKLINLDTPIYHNKTECKLIELPKILEDIVATPFFITSSKQINLLIKPDPEHSLIHTKNFSECQNLEASNYYVDAMEI